MLICGCGRWMHSEGVDESVDAAGTESWFVRCECRACGLKVGLGGAPQTVSPLVDRTTWTDDAKHRLDRMPPYAQSLYKEEVESYARTAQQRVISIEVLARARNGGAVSWEPEAERRLDNVPAAIRSMARVELERTAAQRGELTVTVGLMEEVRARYFGMSERK